MASIREARPDNQYLGFCRGAWCLQNGDRIASMRKIREGRAYSRSGAACRTATIYFQKCRASRCAFRSSFGSSDPNLLWTKVFESAARGIKLRWTFLAKSHVPQRVVVQNKYSYKCLFCVYQQDAPLEAVYFGMDAYLDHISCEHRGKDMDPVLLYKTRCLNNRIADDQDNFDINIWPLNTSNDSEKVSLWLSDENHTTAGKQTQDSIASVNSNHTDIARLYRTEHGDHGRDTDFDAISSCSIAARVDRLYKSAPHLGSGKGSGLAAEQIPNSEWDDLENNPWAETESSCPVIGPERQETRLGSREDPGFQKELTDGSCPVPQIPPRSRLRPSHSWNRLSHIRHDSVWTTSANMTRGTLTTCLNDIVQVYIDAFKLSIDIPAQTTPTAPYSLLQNALSDNPLEIEKLRQRGISLYGASFNVVDDVAVNFLQSISRQLHTELFRPLSQAARDDFISIISICCDSLLHVAESSQQAVVALLKQRLSTLQTATASHPGPAMSPHSLRLSVGRRSEHARALSQDIPMLSHFSEYSSSVPVSTRQPSTASTKPSNPLPLVESESRKRHSVLSFFKHAIRHNQY